MCLSLLALIAPASYILIDKDTRVDYKTLGFMYGETVVV